MTHAGARRTVGVVLALAAAVGGCATKRDVHDLQAQLADLVARQDSTLASLRAVGDSLEAQRNLALQARGDLQRQLFDIERQLVQIQELVGQGQATLNSLRQQLAAKEQALAAPPPAGGEAPAGTPGAAIAVGGEAETLFHKAMEQYRRRVYVTAREGFQEFLNRFPAHELAPDARYHVAETHREEKEWDRALREYARVLELYPNSKRAPTALYKSGLVESERGNRERACEFFRRVLAGYPASDEARVADEQMTRLNCR